MKEIDHKIIKKANNGDKDAIDFIKSKKLPDDFDWEFYVASSKSLKDLKLNEINAICHYLNNGKRKNKEYSRKNTSKWVIPDDIDKIIELQKITNCCFVGSFVDHLYIENNIYDLFVFKDVDIICYEMPSSTNLQLSKINQYFTDNFLKIQPVVPKDFYYAKYKNKNLDIFILNQKIDSVEFKIGDKKINISTIDYRIKTLQAILDNKKLLAGSTQKWLEDKLTTIPKTLDKLKKIKT